MVEMMFESEGVSESTRLAMTAFESKLSQIWLAPLTRTPNAGRALSVTFLAWERKEREKALH